LPGQVYMMNEFFWFPGSNLLIWHAFLILS